MNGIRQRIDRLPQLAFRTAFANDPSGFEMMLRVRQAVSLARQTPTHAIGNLGNGALLAIVFWGRSSPWVILPWLGVFAVISALQLSRWRQQRQRPIPERMSIRPLRRAGLWSLLAGSAWGIAVIYTFPPDVSALQNVLVFLVGGLCAGAVASMGMQPIACMAFIIPSIAPLVLLLATEGGPYGTVMAAMSVLYLLVLVIALLAGFSSFVELVRMKVENQSLTSGLAELQQANRVKSQFLANMSHELRTPLNAIIGFSEIIGDEFLGPVGVRQYREYAKDIHTSGQHLLSIINDVLDLSKLDADRLELDDDELDVGHLIQGARRFVAQRAHDAGVTLSITLAPDFPTLIADEVRLKQILLNLLSNAVKFTPRGGTITVTGARLQSGGAAIAVADTGIGMSAAEIALAMTPFRQVENALTRKYEGTGLGLPIAEGLMRLHGGQITIDSSPGAGTTVSVIFPPERVGRDLFIEHERSATA